MSCSGKDLTQHTLPPQASPHGVISSHVQASMQALRMQKGLLKAVYDAVLSLCMCLQVC